MVVYICVRTKRDASFLDHFIKKCYIVLCYDMVLPSAGPIPDWIMEQPSLLFIDIADVYVTHMRNQYNAFVT